MRIKIATYIDAPIDSSMSDDVAFDIIKKQVQKDRNSYEFVIEEVCGDSDHALVDEVVPMKLFRNFN